MIIEKEISINLEQYLHAFIETYLHTFMLACNCILLYVSIQKVKLFLDQPNQPLPHLLEVVNFLQSTK